MDEKVSSNPMQTALFRSWYLFLKKNSNWRQLGSWGTHSTRVAVLLSNTARLWDWSSGQRACTNSVPYHAVWITADSISIVPVVIIWWCTLVGDYFYAVLLSELFELLYQYLLSTIFGIMYLCRYFLNYCTLIVIFSLLIYPCRWFFMSGNFFGDFYILIYPCQWFFISCSFLIKAYFGLLYVCDFSSTG